MVLVGGVWRKIGVCGALAALAVGCNRSTTVSDRVESRTSALTSASDIRGFENPAGWVANVATKSSPARVQGSASLEVRAAGYTTLTSEPMSTLPFVGAEASLWIMLPTSQANPSWYGAVQLYVTIPSKNQFNVYIGQVELTGLPLGRFTRLSFPLTTTTQSLLRSTYSDLKVTVAVTVPVDAPAPYNLDALQFGANVRATLRCVTVGEPSTLTAYFGYQNLQAEPLVIPIGSDNSFTPGPSDRTQPTSFEVASPASVVAVTFTPPLSITWHLPGGSATATASTPVCPGSAPQQMRCSGTPPDAGSCVTVIDLPGTAPPSLDPAVLGRPYNPATAPPSLPDEDEDEGFIEASTMMTQPAFSLAPNAERTFTASISETSVVAARALWRTAGQLAMTISKGTQTATGALLNRGPAGGSTTARRALDNAGTYQVVVRNTGSTNVTVELSTTVLPFSKVPQ